MATQAVRACVRTSRCVIAEGRRRSQAANATWKKLTDRHDGLWGKWEYQSAKADLESAQRRQTDYETLLAEWTALEAAHDAEVAAAAAEAAAKEAAERARLEAWQKSYDEEIASRPEGWHLFRWNGKDYDGDRVDD